MNTFLTILGYIFSTVFFIISYQKLIGAKKERIKSANESIINVILKRIFLENQSPNLEDLKSLIEGKSRDYKVKTKYLLSLDQIYNTVYTRIFENDLISQDKRVENIKRLKTLFCVEENMVEYVDRYPIDYVSEEKKSDSFFSILVLGIIAISIGLYITFFDEIINLDTTFKYYNLFLILTSMTVLIIMIYIYFKLKESQESSEDIFETKSIKKYIGFEKDVVNYFETSNIKIKKMEEIGNGFDFIVQKNRQDYAVEIKYWKKRPSLSDMLYTVNLMSNGMKNLNIKKGIIIIKGNFELSPRMMIDNNIEAINYKKLKDYFN